MQHSALAFRAPVCFGLVARTVRPIVIAEHVIVILWTCGDNVSFDSTSLNPALSGSPALWRDFIAIRHPPPTLPSQ
ncbi:hypothetical protein DFH11DRAFT_1230772 [Phellopilus nigrolimitatus]|nr:hypothetical protein DFH11DRAFT_1230772 [Phellopilus nigrolimitatus]